MPTKLIKAGKRISDKEIKSLEGSKINDVSGYTIIDDDSDLICSDTGIPIVSYRKKALPAVNLKRNFGHLRTAVITSDNRGLAGGIIHNKVGERLTDRGPIGKVAGTRYRTLKKDGTLSNTQVAIPVQSGIIGYFGRDSRFPYCRECSWNSYYQDKWKQLLPFIKSVDSKYREISADDHQKQLEVAQQINSDFRIGNTVFTTLTVNKNWQTAIHTDKGNVMASKFSGVMTAFTSGSYEGCFTLFPQYEIGVNLRTTDFLLFNNHLHHCNSPLIPKGAYERISLVFYMRSNMTACNSAVEELKFASGRSKGDPLYV